jgi:hypothetical protein
MAATANAAGNLIEHQHDAFGPQVFDVGRGQGIGLGEQTLVHGVGCEPRRERIGPHQLRLNRQRYAVFGEAANGVFGREQLADAARRIGQRRRDRVPAIENGRTAGFPAHAFTVRGLPAMRTVLRARLALPFPLAHGRLLSRGLTLGNSAQFRLTSRCPPTI